VKNTLDIAKRVFDLESQSVLALKDLLTEDFELVVNTVLNSKGRFVITGMGKSGHIGVKISATLASTGTPSFFMHPAEAIHGDLGMLTKDDVLLAISNSGEREEVVRLIPIVKKMGVKLVGMAGDNKSTLAINSDYFLDIAVKKEACPLDLAPTCSTTATLAMGDALAVALMSERRFKPEDFALFHPGGSLGRKLLTKVKNIMHDRHLPVVNQDTSFNEIIHTITSGRLGLTLVAYDGGCGIITDGDLRRALNLGDPSRLRI
jgi:arabinose-5-phosphate isomerase